MARDDDACKDMGLTVFGTVGLSRPFNDMHILDCAYHASPHSLLPLPSPSARAHDPVLPQHDDDIGTVEEKPRDQSQEAKGARGAGHIRKQFDFDGNTDAQARAHEDLDGEYYDDLNVGHTENHKHPTWHDCQKHSASDTQSQATHPYSMHEREHEREASARIYTGLDGTFHESGRYAVSHFFVVPSSMFKCLW